MKEILILGSTGSIGQNTLEVIRQHPNLYKVGALVAGKDWQKLVEQTIEFRPKSVAIFDTTHLKDVKEALSPYKIEVHGGEQGILDLSSKPFDFVMSAIVGFSGLRPSINAIRNSKVVAFANKESLVCAGDLILAEAHKHNCKIMPVDSEHVAISQIFETHNVEQIDKITLTASGGPFRTWSLEQMTSVTPEMAVKHPNWKMGAKITVDCATLINKGLEIIEACRLFPIVPENIDVLVHPQSIIHALVSYKDGSVLAQLGIPDMQTPISYSLSHPNRTPIMHKSLNLAELGKLDFELPDYNKFPLLQLAKDCIPLGNYALIALNTANEVAVNAFLNRQIGFLDIASIVLKVTEQAKPVSLKSFNEIFEYNDYIYSLSKETVENLLRVAA